MEQNTGLGAITAIIAIVFYGSTYVPVRWFEAGDGIYFQWLMCIGQFLVGCVVYFIYGCPQFAPLAMVSGALFALGNALTIFIMDGIGMAVGSLLWNTGTCVIGWAVSRFGLFGTQVQEPINNTLNIIGVIMVCIGGCFFAPIKHHPMKVRPAPAQYPLPLTDEDCEKSSLKGRPSTLRRVVAIVLCIVVGILYGNMLTPINYVIETGMGPSRAEENFFAHCVGTLITATLVFAVYSGVRKNRPFLNPELTLPSLLAGVIYGIATVTMFVANQQLGQIVAYPIISKSPGVIVSLWAVFLFREIRGKWNIGALVAGIASTLIGVAMISLSKIDF